MHFVKDPPIRSALIEFAGGLDIVVAGTGNLEFEIVCEGGLIRIRNDGEEMEVRRKDTRSGFDRVPGGAGRNTGAARSARSATWCRPSVPTSRR